MAIWLRLFRVVIQEVTRLGGVVYIFEGATKILGCKLRPEVSGPVPIGLDRNYHVTIIL